MKIENEVGSGGTVEKYSGGKIELPLPLKIENRSKNSPQIRKSLAGTLWKYDHSGAVVGKSELSIELAYAFM